MMALDQSKIDRIRGKRIAALMKATVGNGKPTRESQVAEMEAHACLMATVFLASVNRPMSRAWVENAAASLMRHLADLPPIGPDSN